MFRRKVVGFANFRIDFAKDTRLNFGIFGQEVKHVGHGVGCLLKEEIALTWEWYGAWTKKLKNEHRMFRSTYINTRKSTGFREGRSCD